jgi:hypothetical protein
MQWGCNGGSKLTPQFFLAPTHWVPPLGTPLNALARTLLLLQEISTSAAAAKKISLTVHNKEYFFKHIMPKPRPRGFIHAFSYREQIA